MGDIPNVSFSSLQTMITSETPLEIKIRFETCIELFSKYSDLELVSKIMRISKSTVKTYLEISKMPDEIIEIALKFDKPKIIAEVAYLAGLMLKAQKQSDDSKINQLDLFATLLSASMPYSSLSSGILSRKKCPMCNSKKIGRSRNCK